MDFPLIGEIVSVKPNAVRIVFEVPVAVFNAGLNDPAKHLELSHEDIRSLATAWLKKANV
jgi:hypothetical protein